MTKSVAPHPLSPRQRQLCDVIERLTAARGYAPSYVEVSREMGLHVSRIHQLAATTQRKGWLRRDAKVARSWRVTRPDVKADKRR